MSRKYLVKTESEIATLAQLFDGGKAPLASAGGKSLRNIFGAKNEYNSGYFYSLKELGANEINNPAHADYDAVDPKYFVLVKSEDIDAGAPQESANLVDFDSTWRLPRE